MKNNLGPLPWIHTEMYTNFKTPMVLVNYDILLHNLQRMSEFAQKQQVLLRPHIKTHKTAEIAQLQLEYGAAGFTVAKISEAEALVASANFSNSRLSILIAFPVIGDLSLIHI